MKDIGRTVDGNWLIEFSPEEHAALGNLASALEGKTGMGLAEISSGMRCLGGDHHGALALVEMVAQSRALVNNLLINVNSLVALLSPQEIDPKNALS